MEIETEIDLAGERVTHKCSGLVCVSQMADRIDEMLAAPGFSAQFGVLWDLREAEMSAVSYEDVQKLARHVMPWWSEGNGKTAVVVAGPLAVGRANQFDAHTHRSARLFGVFRDHALAIAWLGNA